MTTVGTPLLWGGFTLLVVLLLFVDHLLVGRRDREIRPREALAYSAGWVALALLFNVFVARRFGAERGLEFTTGYLIELALSVDNLFVFIMLFSYFHVRPAHQRRVLFWGIVGAQVMRGVFILVGAALLSTFHWLLYVFGAFLVYTGAKLAVGHGSEVHPEKNPAIRWFGKVVPTLPDFYGGRFTVKLDGKRYATALLPVLLVIEMTDLVFAFDSIPAVFAVTRDPFIVYTSNIFAILGLRSFYFLLAHAMAGFRYLKYGLGVVLVFVGGKMLASGWFEIPIRVSLLVVVALLGISIVASLLHPGDPDGDGGGKMAPRR